MSFSDNALNKAIVRGIDCDVKQYNRMHTTKPTLTVSQRTGVVFSESEVNLWSHVVHLCYAQVDKVLKTGTSPISDKQYQSCRRLLSRYDIDDANRTCLIVTRKFLVWAKVIGDGKATEEQRESAENEFSVFLDTLTEKFPSSTKKKFEKFKVWTKACTRKVLNDIEKELKARPPKSAPRSPVNDLLRLKKRKTE